jgi:Transposase DDE domain
MFVRVKPAGGHQYLQIVHNQRRDGRVRQQVVGTLGRLDQLQAGGQVDQLLASLGRFAQESAVLSACRQGAAPTLATVKIGPPLVFGRLWEELGLPRILAALLQDRKFGFAVERAIFVTVLHRLLDPGSDRAAEAWKDGYAIPGAADLDLQHFYRAMAWLGEALPPGAQADATRPGNRCTKDLIEEALFAGQRDLFSGVSLAFFDTTSLYFEGAGGTALGRHGYSKDHRPDLKQLVAGAVLNQEGLPVCCELWPGNTTDVTTLVPVLTRLRRRFGVQDLCLVADRGMISAATVQTIERDYPGTRYILGARLRSCAEVRDKVLSWGGRYHEVHPARTGTKDPSPLSVKDVRFTTAADQDRRYVVCYNPEQAAKDKADREAILAALEDQLKRGDKSLVGNKGFRKYLKVAASSGGGGGGKHFEIDRRKVEVEARFDGKWVLLTNWWEAEAAEVALRYKELWMVEQAFRSVKSVLQTRPIYHKCDETIRGHVFCSFLALLLMKVLQQRLAARFGHVEWGRLCADLDALARLTVEAGGQRFELRPAPRGEAGKAVQAAGVALGPALRRLE